ncbi:hypothetical protein VNO78_20246 [Psophocarpus tetragonolobus]|uniref:Uncharacterized protein n=1 Tax=Psophocarpus tetragonolobus TaxID=3891 RepID=A0AAN9XHB8_PSOTE
MGSNVEVDTSELAEWVITIRGSIEKVWATELDLEDSHTVCICQVPESLSGSKREAFIPQFVGIGPYHHSRKGLFKEKHKLAAAKRVLKDLLSDMDLFVHRVSMFSSDIQTFYHPDVKSTYDNNTHTLFSVLTVDGLFLLAFITLLSSATNSDAGGLGFSYFLTGKLSMPFFNAQGVELTKNALIREVFKLENQIPFDVLNRISGVNEILSEDEPLGSSLHDFCKQHCPLVKFEVLTNNIALEGHHHLLDLMYHLIVPKRDQSQVSETEFQVDIKTSAEIEPQIPAKAQTQVQDGVEPQVQAEVETQVQAEVETQVQARKGMKRTCYNILVFLVVICLVLGFTVSLILRLFLRVISYIYSRVLRVLRSLIDLVKRAFKVLRRHINPVLRLVHQFLSWLEGKINNPFLKYLKEVVGNLVEITQTMQSTDSDEGVRQIVMIPSVFQLHEAEIRFKPAEKGVLSIDFNDKESIFYLPRIRLDGNSEVIIRNLVAYETLIKSNTPMVFTKYVELMRAIIDTPADVKILVDSEIIESELTAQAIADLFNGMNKSIRPTKTPELDRVIHKVNAKFDSNQKRKRVVTKYTSGSFLAPIGGLLFLLFTALQTYCTVYNCSGTPKFGKSPQDEGYYGRNDYFVSSM